MKKGNRSWKPATVLATFKRNPDYRYKYVRDDADNIARHLAEHWEMANETIDPKVQTDVKEQIDPITRGRKVRELVLMRLPLEVYEQRKAYYDNETDKSEAGLKARLQSEIGAAPVHGTVEIESRSHIETIE